MPGGHFLQVPSLLDHALSGGQGTQLNTLRLRPSMASGTDVPCTVLPGTQVHLALPGTSALEYAGQARQAVPPESKRYVPTGHGAQRLATGTEPGGAETQPLVLVFVFVVMALAVRTKNLVLLLMKAATASKEGDDAVLGNRQVATGQA